MSEPELPPPRLVESPGAAGECLRQALAEEEQRRLPRFAALQERRARRSKRQVAVLFIAAAAAIPVGLRVLQRPEPQVIVRAEPVPARAPSAAASLVPLPIAPHEEHQEQQALQPSPSKVASQRAVHGKPRVAVAPQPAPAPRVEAAPPRAADPNGGAKACAELARNGAAEQAMACYDKLANGSGVIAELALFEQARLAGKVLRQPARALATLDGYKQRFPNGSLRAEVMLARIDWLLGAGDKQRALQAVDDALASGLLRERTAELERLRSSLAQ